MAEEHPQESQVSAARAPSLSVWARIKEHKVAQWTLAYAAAALALLEGAKLISDAFEWPHQVVRIVTVLLILGIPLVVTLAWYHGHRALRRVSRAELTIITVLLVMAAAVLWHFARSPQEPLASKAATTEQTTVASAHPVAAIPAVTTGDKSIAVLPFADISEKKDQEYFSDGLSEDLITALSHFPGLKVIGRTSSFTFRDSKDDSRTIGVKLGVAHLLEGSVRRASDMVRVSAELIDTSDGSTQWSERYDRPYKDLFRLQDDLTHSVAGALKAHLLPSKAASVQQTERPPSGNLEAYNAVLEGKYYLARDTVADTRRAIERFDRATQLDPRYAFAWSSLSRAWTDLGAYHLNLATSPEAYSKARAAVSTALSLAPDLASAHIARGWLLDMGDLDWRGAAAEYRRAFELAPESGDAAASLARQAANFGQVGRAIELTQQALATDPLHSRWYGWLAGYLSALNRLDEAEVAIRRAVDLQPGGVRLHYLLSEIEIRRGNAQAALAAAQQEPPGSYFRDAALAKALQSGNDRMAADAALKNLIDKGATWDPYDVAQIYAMRNDADKTFEWLDRAWKYRDPAFHYLRNDPFIRRYKEDPRFDAWLRRVKLVE